MCCTHPAAPARPSAIRSGDIGCGGPWSPTRSISTLIGASATQSPKNWRIVICPTSGTVRSQFPGCSSGLTMISKLPSQLVIRSLPMIRPTSADSPGGVVSCGR